MFSYVDISGRQCLFRMSGAAQWKSLLHVHSNEKHEWTCRVGKEQTVLQLWLSASYTKIKGDAHVLNNVCDDHESEFEYYSYTVDHIS